MRGATGILVGVSMVTLFADRAMAQGCVPGAPVEYKAQGYPEKWERGTCVRPLPGGTQVLIRQAPTQFFPEGFERAYGMSDVRPAGGAHVAAPARPAVQPTAPEPVSTVASTQGGGGTMSEQDVLAFLRARLGGGDPFANPNRAQVLQQLREEIMRRGVSFRYATLGDFSNELGKFGATSEVRAPLAQNFGPPARLGELTGRWRLHKVGATTTFNKGNETWRRMEYSGDAGSLMVNANGSYSWDSPSGLFQGQWRKATPDEMAKSDKGGEGVVLIRAKSGADWLVFRRNEEGPVGTGILVTDLATNLRERGVR